MAQPPGAGAGGPAGLGQGTRAGAATARVETGLEAAPTALCVRSPAHCPQPAGMLNQVIELWRYPSAQACHDARKAARGVPQWRETIAAVTPGVQHFTSSFMHAVPFSPMQ